MLRFMRGTATIHTFSPFHACPGYAVEGPSGVLGSLERIVRTDGAVSPDIAHASGALPAGVIRKLGGSTGAVLVIRSSRRGSLRYFVPEREVDSVDNGAGRIRIRAPEVLCALLPVDPAMSSSPTSEFACK